MIERETIGKLLPATSRHPQTMFRVGQIIYGKVIQILPNDTAEIMLNGMKTIAQLNTPLSIGDKHYFQVTSEGEIPALKIIGEKATGQPKLDAEFMLQTLGAKSSKMNKVFLAYLLKENVTFTKSQLHAALTHYHHAQDKSQAIQIIQAMVTRGLPMTKEMYQTLQIKNEHSLTSVLQGLLNELEKNDTNSELVKNLMSMSSKSLKNVLSTDIPMFLHESGNSKEQLQRLLYVVLQRGMRDISTDSSLSMKKSNDSIIPTIAASVKSIDAFQDHVNINRQPILNESKQLVNNWETVIINALANNRSLSDQEARLFQVQADRLMAVLLGNDSAQAANRSPSNMVQWVAFAKGLQDGHLFQTIASEGPEAAVENEALRRTFLHQITQIFHNLGLYDKNPVQHQLTPNAATTVKGLIFQLLQVADALPVKERAEQLLHYINAMQLDAVQEMNNQLYTVLQIPGGKWGLPQDMELQITGKKRSDGKIDKEFCHILFYLNLAALKETLIDMHVQKRSVRITVFNNHEHLQALAERFKPLLSQGLESIDYHLSSIHFKALKQEDGPSQWKKGGNGPFMQAKGVDVRI